MKELIEALTRAANAVAAHYEGKPVAQTRAVAAEPAPEKDNVAGDVVEKPKRAKKAAAAPAADIGLDAAPAAEKKATGMSEEESTKGVTDVAKLLVSKFSTPVAPDNKPEGFHIAKKLLIEDYKVGRLSDLSHEQRVSFIAVVKEALVDEKKAREILTRKTAAA